ncbi:tyrosine-type recombinase/integrase [Leisingera aquimarina]|uniref:tyrosine-type recombinase/integrase n=1 Tax=Leisingera aquimarina TaxID=476529 RepID=UPI00041B16B8|nr:tyrosine-type recombinase/integrase [Leisingera aquimarina]
MAQLAQHLAAFLRNHLPNERRASVHTCDAYAYSFQLLVTFAAGRLRKRPCLLQIEDIDVPTILAFLEHIEQTRGNKARTRNARLAAVKSFFRYLEHRVPAMLHLAFAGGLRVSELISAGLNQFDGRSPASIHIIGKGRRERVLPLWQETAAAIRAWIAIRPEVGDTALFLNNAGRMMTRAGFEYILEKHANTAARIAPTLAAKSITPHVLRHSCAMHHASGDPGHSQGRTVAWSRHAPEHRDLLARRPNRKTRDA